MKIQLQNHLKEGLTNLLEAQKLHNCLSLEQAINLSDAIDNIDSIVKELEQENQLITRTDIAVVDMLLEACK